MIKVLAAFLLLSGLAFAQGTRIGDDRPVQSLVQDSRLVTSTGVTPQFVTAPGAATINLCSRPANAVPCTNKATTYTDVTVATPCSTSTQVVLAGTTTCVGASDSGGNWGAWVKPGNYDFTITIQGLSFGPFTIGAGAVPSGSGTFVETAPTAPQTITGQTLNLTSGSRLNAGAGIGTNTFQGPSPWFDVTDPAYGAKCDGATDDTTAFNNAITAANAVGGGTVFIPPGKTCVIAGQVNAGLTAGVTITGGMVAAGYTIGASTIGKPLLKFTGTTSPLIDMRSTVSDKVIGVNIQYTNAAFNGEVLAAEHTGAGCGGGGCDTNQLVVEDVTLSGTTTSKLAVCLLCLDKTIDSEITRVTLEYAVNGIRGLASNGSYSFNNHLRLVDIGLGYPNGTISGTAIRNPGSAWEILNPDIELGTDTVNGIDNVTDGFGVSFGLTINGGFFGDCNTPTYTGKEINLVMVGSITANAMGCQGAGPTAGTAIALPNGGGATLVQGNDIGAIQTGISLGTTTPQYAILGNNFRGSVTTPISGTPTNGLIYDSNNKLTIYNGNAPNVALGMGTDTTLVRLGAQQIAFGDVNGANRDLAFIESSGLGTVGATPLSLYTNNTARWIIGGSTANLSPNAAAGGDLGTTALPVANFWLGTAATNNLKFQPAAMAAARVLTVPDPLGAVTMPYVIASGTTTLTANAALAAVTSQAVNTTAATNALTTDSIEWSFSTAPTAGDNLCHVLTYLTAGNVNFVRTNPTAAAQNVSALVINWRVIR